ncbi:MAG: arginine--tRNA ligase [Alphaproteobacteria bacterium]|nr:arginine--tRNA ligase [Alphaproteobacteria bacterium]
MNLYSYFREEITSSLAALAASGKLPSGLDSERVTAEPPREAAHGDVSTNAALVMAKPAGMKPRDFATVLAEALGSRDDVLKVEIAGPGFVNLRLRPAFWHERLAEILREGERYGASTLGRGLPVNVEYVSANPTGPMHVGHGRGAVVGDILAALLARIGYAVTREYYINDAGAQVDVLARSAYLRYLEALDGAKREVPEGLYPGEYLVPVGQALKQRDGARWQGKPESEWLAPVREFAINAMMDLIRDDLQALGVRHARFTSERHDVVEKQRVQQVVDSLKARDLVYTGVLEPPKGMKPDDWEPRPQMLFRSTQFGDDVDRPLQKSDGSWTYFAADIAYHLDKVERGFNRQIDVWGADHGGYVKRMQAAVKAVSGGKATLEVKLCQLVNLLERGEPVKMSKRAGTFVTLRDVIDRLGEGSWAGAGAGIVRFIMLTRKHDQHLDFDFAKATEQSKDNQLFYVQYAHARTRSAFRQAKEALPDLEIDDVRLGRVNFAALAHEDEIGLIKTLAGWPRLLEGAAESGEPHRVAFYLYELASAFHALWTRGKEEPALRFVVADNRELTLARLSLVRAVGMVIASGLRLIGVEPVEEMR